MPLDMCVPADADRDTVEKALARTTEWETRCRQAHVREDQLLFGIVQGGMFEDLRERSADRDSLAGLSGLCDRRAQRGRVQIRDVRDD